MWQAVLIMFIAMSAVPAGDLFGKLLTSVHGEAPVYVAWSRFLVGALMALPFIRPRFLRLLKDWRIWFRAGLITCGVVSIQTALSTEPLADVFAAFFIGPIISYALAALFLREPITPIRTLLMVTGFIGVLLVVRPGPDGSPGLLWAVAAGSFYGAFLTSSRWLAHVGTPVELIFSQLALPALALTPVALLHLPPATPTIAGLTLGSAAFSAGGNLLLLYAYAKSAATRLAPFVYFQLVAAAGLGWAVFGALPHPVTWAGLTLIVGSGLVSASLRR